MPGDLLTIRVKNTSNRPLEHHPLTCGVPLPKGALKTDRGLALRQGKIMRPVQTRVLERHFDKSIRWLLVDADIACRKNADDAVVLTKAAARPPAGIKVTQGAQRITVATPHYTVAIGRKEFSLFNSYRVKGREMVQAGSDILVETPEGKRFYASGAKKISARVVESGPLRVVVEVEGRHTAGDDAEMLSFRVRYTFRLHDPCVLISYRFTNREAPELGVKLGGIRILLPATLGRKTVNFLRQTNSGTHWYSRRVTVKGNIELVASTAVNAAAKSRYGGHADGKVVVRDLAGLRENPAQYPYYLRPGNIRADISGGLRAVYPYVGVAGESASFLGWFDRMDCHFPKGIAADRDTLTLDVWPSWAGELQVRRGQSKEHDFHLAFFNGSVPHEELEGVYFDHEIQGYGVFGTGTPPVQVTLDPDYVRRTEVLDLHRWLRFDDEKYTAVEQKIGSFGHAGAPTKGFFDYGDSVGADRAWCHNNENDAILDGIRDYFRRGLPAALDGAIAKAHHNAHVDFIDFDPDPLRRGTMPAHCPEHTDGATYPSHMWTGGLLAAYCLTGNEDFRRAAVAVGENMLRWQKRNPTIFYADSRECGWPMLGWLQLHAHTHETRWLKACREVFEFYRDNLTEDAKILYELPHGVGIYVGGYGEFIAWRAMFFYYERTGEKDVRDLLVRALDKVYRITPQRYAAGGWACNDLFPAWAAYALTRNDRYIEDNYPFMEFIMRQAGGFAWGGVDVHYYLNELDRRGTLPRFCK